MLTYAEVRRRCLKPNEAEKPLYGRYVTHTISTLIVWLISSSSVSPNLITLISLVVGLTACWFLYLLTPGSLLLGAILIECYYILDCVDGQWARFKQNQTKTGAFFDIATNYLIQPCLYFAIALGLFNITAELIFVIAGFLAAFTTLWIIIIWHFRASIFLHSIRKAGTIRVKQASSHTTNEERSKLSCHHHTRI